MSEKSFTIRFILTLIIGLAFAFGSMLLAISPLFNGACGLVGASIALLVFKLV
jgi:hypothetical protein